MTSLSSTVSIPYISLVWLQIYHVYSVVGLKICITPLSRATVRIRRTVMPPGKRWAKFDLWTNTPTAELNSCGKPSWWPYPRTRINQLCIFVVLNRGLLVLGLVDCTSLVYQHRSASKREEEVLLEIFLLVYAPIGQHANLSIFGTSFHVTHPFISCIISWVCKINLLM